MLQRRGEAAECTGKRQYTSYHAAYRDSKGMNRHWGTKAGDPYHCHFCGFFHIGSSMKSTKKRNRHQIKQRIEEYGD